MTTRITGIDFRAIEGSRTMSRNPIPPRVPPRPIPAARGSEDAAASVAAPAAGASAAAGAAAAAAASPPAARPSPPGGPVIVARAAAYYRNTRYLMVVLLLGTAGWFAYDGFKGWPQENAKIARLNKELDAAKRMHDAEAEKRLNDDPMTHNKPHSDTDIRFQKILAGALPLGALAMLIWTLYHSRGAYRLEGNTLSAPGHPKIQLSDITEVDKRQWDKKGIARLTYAKPGGGKGKILLDDFVYERDPIDAIYDRVEAQFAPGGAR
jgi:hypothetical protein